MGWAELATTRTNTWPSPTLGWSTSTSRNTSLGAPYPCWTIALIMILFPAWEHEQVSR